MEELEKLLRSHDWYYEFSDDNRVWRRGSAQREEIEKKGKTIERKEFESLWAQYAPKEFQCPV